MTALIAEKRHTKPGKTSTGTHVHLLAQYTALGRRDLYILKASSGPILAARVELRIVDARSGPARHLRRVRDFGHVLSPSSASRYSSQSCRIEMLALGMHDVSNGHIRLV